MSSPGFTHDNVNNLSIEWYTPPWVFKKLNLEFDLDPCAPIGGVPWIPARQSYSISDDGLSKDWGTNLVWLNPPYGRHTKDWLHKMHLHRKGIALVFSRTDCAWFYDYAANSDGILFLKGRVNFIKGLDGEPSKNSSGCGSMLVAWGEESILALSKMDECGIFIKITRLGK